MKLFLKVGTVILAALIFGGGCGRGDALSGSGTDGRASRQGDTGGSWRGTDSAWQYIDTAWQYIDTAMGTVIQQSIYTAREDEADEITAQIMEYLEELERERLSWRLDTSEVYQLNASAGSGEGYPVSEELFRLLDSCMDLFRLSEGAFDVTMGPVVRLWNIDQWAAGEQETKFQPPSSQALAQALEKTGSGKLTLEDSSASGQMIVHMPEGIQIDLGAVGKGYSLTGIGDLLEQKPEITGAVISVGGSILTYGTKPDGSSWKVGVVDPGDTASYICVLSLEGQWCVSTSGDYERYVEADGVRYHHILDPATGYPADSGVRGVTVLSKDGLLSDGLSTACFILGPEKGMELAEWYDAEVLFVLEDGNVIMSEGMKEYCDGSFRH